MMFALDHNEKTVAKLKVIGVGGAGGNAVNRMVQSGLQGVEFIVLNTDAMALQKNAAEVKMQIGSKLTQGLGAGANPQVGMLSMQEDMERLRDQLEGADMVFIAAGMGGGTGTGAAPVVAELARSMGILTVAVVTKPFQWEGSVRDRNAQSGLEALRRCADTVIVVPNQKLLSVVERNTPMRQAFKMADEILSSATRGISEIILGHGEVNADFADVRAVMAQGGDALMGTGRASGENKARIAADRAIPSPLLDSVSIAGATALLVNITGGEDMSMVEVDEAMNYLTEELGRDTQANIISGFVFNPDMGDEIAVTVIATGFGGSNVAKAAAAASAARPAMDPVRRPMAAPSAPMTPVARIELPTASATLSPAASFSAPAEMTESPEVSLLPKVPEPRTRLDDGQMGKVPFGASRAPAPAARAPFVPVPRPAEEPRPQMQENVPARSAGGLLSGLFGNAKDDSEPDIDYETPAFLRNQAD
jgi:cell division protein FtsZ